jgi:hypothetical protein
VSELNGHRPGSPAQGEPEQTRPVTFTWQRQTASAVETGPGSGTQPVVASAPPPDRRSVGAATGAQSAVAVDPPTGAQPATAPSPQPAQHQTGAHRAAPAHPAREVVEQSAADRSRRRRRGARAIAQIEIPVSTGPESQFAVPPPGGRLANGRGAHLAVRVGIAFTACLLLLGITFIVGLFAGREGTDKTSGISAGALNNYHVEQYPLQAAAAVAERYTRLCLNAQPSNADQRSAQLQSIVSSNVPNDCGWDGRGTLTASDIAWTGQADPMTQYGSHGRYMHMQASLGDQATPIQLIVPVYVANLKDGTGVRVAGEPGILPASGSPSGPDAVTEKDGSSDTGLAQMLTADVLPGFFDAWGSSSSADIDRFRTPDATANVRNGLSNILTDPSIQGTNVPLPGSGIGAAHTWQPGDAATVETTVTWQVPGGAHITLAYRLTMVHTTATATGWSVRDIAGGIPDSDVDNTSGNAITSDLPTTDPATPNDSPTATPTQESSAPPPSKHSSSSSNKHSSSSHTTHHHS